MSAPESIQTILVNGSVPVWRVRFHDEQTPHVQVLIGAYTHEDAHASFVIWCNQMIGQQDGRQVVIRMIEHLYFDRAGGVLNTEDWVLYHPRELSV